MAMVYGYGRASTNKQSLTQEAQRLKVSKHITANLSEHAYAGWLYDNAVSGSRPLFDRPQGRRLWDLLEPGDHVVWAKLDRAFRSVVDGAKALHTLHAKGVFVHSLDLGLNTGTPTGRFISTVILAFAELERECIGERTREGMAALRRAGRPYGRFAPIGWKKVGRGRTACLKPDATERSQVQEIVRLRLEHGLSLEQVVQAMRHTPRPNGHYWNRNSVARAERALRAGFPKHTPNPAALPGSLSTR